MKQLLLGIAALHIAAASHAGPLWEPIMNKGASFVPAGYGLVFNDEFRGDPEPRALGDPLHL